MLRPARTVGAMVLLVVMAGGAIATAGVGSVTRPADVGVTAQRVDVGELVHPTTPVTPAAEVSTLVNQERSRAGLAPVDWHDQVAAAASAHSQDMARTGRMQHQGSDGSDAGDRLRAAGFQWGAWGEAVAAGQPNAAAVVDAWMNSPGHRAILLGQYRYVGVAVVTSSAGTPYWTLVAAS